jgi:hypothetical protein
LGGPQSNKSLKKGTKKVAAMEIITPIKNPAKVILLATVFPGNLFPIPRKRLFQAPQAIGPNKAMTMKGYIFIGL